jgi:predicted amidohydrolase YtcJ
MKTAVDTIIYNAKIYTVNQTFEMAESFAIQDGKFIAVGSNEFIRTKYSSSENIDLDGKPVFPGFIDAHCHFYGLGMTMQQVNLVGVKSEDEMLERIQVFQNERQTDFITGRGWDQTIWESKNFPTKDKLDKLFPETPVAVTRIDGHAMIANSTALNLAGIHHNTIIDGGEIELKEGRLTGILLDNAMNLVYDAMPKPNTAILKKALIAAQEKCFSYGLTSVHDADLKQNVVELMQEMQATNDLKMRIYAMVFATDSSLDYYLTKGKIKTDKLTVGAFKIYMDGALGSMGALMKTPYENKDKKGVLVTTVETLQKFGKRIAASEFQLNVHAIGDQANHLVLKTFVADLKITKDRRWRIEHAQIVDEPDFEYYKTVLPSVQPTHATSDMYWAEKILGKERMKGAYAYKRLLELHGKLPLGTDFPIEKVNPFLTFLAAVARKDTKGFPEKGFQMQDALTREETLKGMTIWGAYAAFEENEKGSIEQGKYADFVVLDQDIMEVEMDKIPKTNVLRTYSGGELVYGE